MLELDPVEAEKVTRFSVCSDCWGRLTAKYDPSTRTSKVSCSTEGCACKGFVSSRYVEKREEAARSERMEATVALTRAGVLPKKSAGAILSELGF